MGWVNDVLKELKENKIAKVRPFGTSMRGKIESGQLVTIELVSYQNVNTGDIVFVKWKNNYLLHLIKEIQEDKFLIGNNLGKINDWVLGKDIIGKVTSVCD